MRLVLALCLLLASCGGGSDGHDIAVPPPPTLRTDLLFGYYAADPGQVAETIGHTNMLFEAGLFGPEVQMRNIAAARMPTILDVSAQLYLGQRNDHHPNPDGEALLRDYLAQIGQRGLLRYVIALYPIDEPNITVRSEADVLTANATARKVAAEFPALQGVRLAAIYAGGHGWPAIADYEIVGVDDYGSKSSILGPGGFYVDMIQHLRPDQRTIIVPGGAFGQDPAPFVNFAHSDQRVLAIVPFIYFDGWEAGKMGIRSNGMARAYCLAGEQIKTPGRTGACS